MYKKFNVTALLVLVLVTMGMSLHASAYDPGDGPVKKKACGIGSLGYMSVIAELSQN